ncbi:hypothetical protein [Leifsonia sp. Root227]|uniref:hypothetical protein n=1 Tax=Leifsonia sp. Root227 TaxID=1736496 RepID=UPI000B2A0ECB|nr:hypothetical protein [Leifsonia sp. Root227]
MPASLQAQLRDDYAVVPVSDAPTVATVVAWPPHSRSEAVADLVRTPTEQLRQEGLGAPAPAPNTVAKAG